MKNTTMKVFRILILLGVIFLANSDPSCAQDKAATKAWKQHRDAGRTALKKGKFEEAVEEFESALKASETFPSQDIRHVEALSDLANVYVSVRKYEKAEPLCEKALELRQGVISLKQLQVELSLRLQLCDIYKYTGKLEKAEHLLITTKGLLEKQFGAFHFSVSHVQLGLGDIYRLQKEHAKSESAYKLGLKISESMRTQVSNLEISRANEMHIARILNGLGLTYKDLKNYPAAEDVFLKTIKIIESNESKSSASLTSPLLNLTYVYLGQGAFSKAETTVQRVKKIAGQHAEADHPFHRDVVRAEAEIAKLRN